MSWLNAIGTVAGGLGSIFGSRSRESSWNSSGSTRRFISPEQQRALGMIESDMLRRSQDPEGDLLPFRDKELQRVESAYRPLAGGIEESFAKRGMPYSGKIQQGEMQTGLARSRAFSGVEADHTQRVIDRRDSATQLAQWFASLNLGTDFTQSGTQRSAGNLLGESFNQGAGILGALLGLARKQNPGGDIGMV